MHISDRYFYRDIQNFPDQLDRPHVYTTPHTSLDVIMVLSWAKVVGIFVRWASGLFGQCDFFMGYWLFASQKWHPKDSGCWITDFRAVSSELCSVKARKPTFHRCDLRPLCEILCLLQLESLGITLYPHSPTREVLCTDDNQMLKEENSRISHKYLFIMGLDRMNANNSSHWHSLKLIHLWSVTSS